MLGAQGSHQQLFGGGGAAGPQPLAVSDFKNGIYSIGGASKTFAQMWDYAGTPVDPLTDVGLDLGPQGGTTSASATIGWHAAAELYAELAEVSCTAVFDLSVTGQAPEDGVVIVRIGFGAAGDRLEAHAEFGPEAAFSNVGLRQFISGVWSYTNGSALSGPFNGDYRVAANFDPASYADAYNGGAIVSGTPLLNFNAASVFYLILYSWRSTTAHVTLKKVTFYPLQDEADLPALST